MGDHENALDRHASLDPEVEKVGAQGFRGEHVERRKRLVHQENIGVDDERPRKADPLAHAAGKFLREGELETVESDEVDRFQRAPARFVLGDLFCPESELDIGEHGQPRKQRKTLKHHGDAIDRTGYLLAKIAHLAAGGENEPGDDPQERGFAAARPAEQADDFVLFQIERHIVEDRRAKLARSGLVALRDVSDFKQGLLACKRSPRIAVLHDITSIEPQAPFGETVKRTPKKAVEHDDEDRHDRDAEHDFGIIAIRGRLGDVGADPMRRHRVVAPFHIFRDDRRVPGSARGGQRSRHVIGENSGDDNVLPPIPAANAKIRDRFLEIVRKRRGSGNDVEKNVPLRAEDNQKAKPDVGV